MVCLLLLSSGCDRLATRLGPDRAYQASLQELRRGELKSALGGVDRALRVFSDPASNWYWRFTALKAEILIWQGLSKESLKLLDPDLPRFLSDSDTAVWWRLTRASAHTSLLEFKEAEGSLTEAERLAKENHPELLGYVELRKGTLSDFRGDTKVAAAQYRAALRAAREREDSYLEASALGSLGLVATEEEHYVESIDWNRQALLVSQGAGAKSLAAKIQLNTGWSYFEIGDYEGALALFQQAEEAAGIAGLVSDQVICRINIGAVEYYLRDYAASERESQLALGLALKLDEKKLVVQSLNTLALVALKKGQLDAAENYNRQSLEVSRTVNDHTGEVSSLLIAGQIESGRRQYRRAEELLGSVIADQAAGTALQWEAEARLAKVYADEGQPMKAHAEFSRSIQTIEAARASISSYELQLTFLSSAIEFYDDYVDFLFAQKRPDEALNIAELSRAQTLAEGLASSTGTSSHALRRVQPQQIAKTSKASLLFYWMGHNHSYLWVIGPTKITYFELPKASDIDPIVKSYRKALLGMRDAQDKGNSDGKQLYAMLVEPAKKLLPPGSQVILLPAESLYGLNFETLIVPDPEPHFWIEDVTLTTANSLTLLASSPAWLAPKEKSLLLVGNTEPPNSDFPVLLQAPAEMRQVKQYFPEAQSMILEGMRATPAAYLSSNPGRFAYLHFITHGTASRTRPLESAVILSKNGESYKLYARDIVQHRLNANLVTISACNGAGTRAYSGEGLVGLSWAFLRAGAHNVIAALWEVSDASTPQLMDSLYSELSKGKDPATALRNAKLTLLHSRNVFAKPFYWAPFQLYTGS